MVEELARVRIVSRLWVMLCLSMRRLGAAVDADAGRFEECFALPCFALLCFNNMLITLYSTGDSLKRNQFPPFLFYVLASNGTSF